MKDCREFKYMVAIKSHWCYRTLEAHSCHEERECCVPIENYDHCGKEGKHFKPIPPNYTGFKFP